MSNELQKFEILLNKSDNIFAPGDTVDGQVVVELNATKSIKGLKIIFLGRAEVKWSEPGGSEEDNYTKWHLASEEYFRLEYYLLGGAGNTERVQIKSGCNAYPFNFCLPQKIPSTFEHYHGNVKYTIIAVMDKTSKYNAQVSMDLKVQTPCDLNQRTASKLPIEDGGEDVFSCFPCFKAGTIAYSIYLPSSVYTVGDILQTRFIIHNKSTVDVKKIKLQLKQSIKLRASGSTYKDTDMVQISEERGPFGMKEEIIVGMIVPEVAPSNFPYCSIIDIQYFLNVDIVISGCHCNIHRKFPILIGTDPELNRNCRTTSEPEQNPSSLLTVEPSAPPADVFRVNKLMVTTVTLPPEKPPDSDGPAPHSVPTDGSVTAIESCTRPNSSIDPAVNYPTVSRPSIGFSVRNPPGHSTSISDEAPPSYEECVKLDA